MYYKLKTSFLEETLNDVLCEDGFDVLEMTQSEDLGVTLLGEAEGEGESVNGGPELPLDISAIVQQSSTVNFSNLKELPTPQALSNLSNLDENHVIRKFEAIEELPQNQNAWGESVSKQQSLPVELPTTLEAAKSRAPSIKPSITNKLFQSTRSFAKRNPRKPMSRSSLNLSSSSSLSGAHDEQAEQLPDLETILIRKAQDYKATEAIAANALLATDHSKEAIKTHVDERWLQRNTAENTLEQRGLSKTEHNNNNAMPAKKHNFGLSNIDVSKLQSREQPAELKPLPQVEELPQELPVAAAPAAPAAAAEDSDSDSVVADSEEEADQPEYRHIVKRRKIMPTNESPPEMPAQSAVETLNKEGKEAGEEKEQELKDFSADEERDATYEPKLSKREQRKQATAKRRNEKKPKAEKPAKAVKPVKQPKAPKAAKEPKAKAKAKTKATAKTAVQQEQEQEPEEQPLNPEDLKYVLALEAGDITSVPRIKPAELEQADEMAQRYISNFAMGTTTTAGLPGQVDEKRAAARKKLQEKIAAGKLNENFVTINIQKKKFARGKKSINFSKYKKTQWRHKKRVAALTGPDMDMGGCDGGVLTCFQCGGVGHFAQQCKVKGDTLLPLTAQLEEDPSPFPTLEEAEQMATQGALAAHSRNIERLPQAANAAIYQTVNSSSSSDEEEDPQETPPNDDAAHMSSDDSDMDFEALDAAVEASQHQTPIQAQSHSPAQISPIKNYVGHKIPEEFLKQAGLDASSKNGVTKSQHGGVKPLYELNADGSVPELTEEVIKALHMFGHTDFRKGKS